MMSLSPDTTPTSALDETLRAIRDRGVEMKPRVGLILGSELGLFSDRLKNVVRVPLDLDTDSDTHHVALGYIDDVPVACLEGRGALLASRSQATSWRRVHGARVLARLGSKAVLVTEPVGTLSASWAVGSLALVTDHIALSGGMTDWMGHLEGSEFFDPFPSMHPAYDPALTSEMHDVVRAENLLSARIASKALGGQKPIELSEGVYAGLPDPVYETPAQVRVLQSLGASFIGTRLIPEVVALRQLGVRVTALVYSSYLAAGIATSSDDLDEATSSSDLGPMYRLIRGWIVRASRMID
jgi:purine-nucleoside phosphorylase